MAAARVLGSTLIVLSRKPSSASSYSSGSSPLLLRWQWRRLYSSSGSRLSMSLKAGIVGLPNVGKSTLFNAVVENGKAQAANFPFCTIEPNVGIVAVPDPRLNVLGELSKSQRTVPASIEFVDIAGLVKGASQGEGSSSTIYRSDITSQIEVLAEIEDHCWSWSPPHLLLLEPPLDVWMVSGWALELLITIGRSFDELRLLELEEEGATAGGLQHLVEFFLSLLLLSAKVGRLRPTGTPCYYLWDALYGILLPLLWLR
ncbi:hypothetical protein B296_00043822 [Ensete ventricosum]|uniref:OBG-type G domain-containing protein n=1 Tax=Ensete ventricosum TaxID=4639 RepID=A0A426ZBC1_ENSVE|nr:hypothetical protein B296_00043822 [Ensete ventricosum]